MSSTESGDENQTVPKRPNATGDMSVSAKIERLTSTLQNTNRNLRAVDKMLEKYKDLGDQKAAVVSGLRDDVLRSEAGTHSAGVDQRLSSEHRGSFRSALGRRRPQSCERPYASDRDIPSYAAAPAGHDSSVRFFDDMDVRGGGGGSDSRFLHRSGRESQYELDQDRNRRLRLDLESRRPYTSASAGVTDVRQLESLQNELRAERQVWRSKHDDLCRISSELKQALLDRRRTAIPAYSSVDRNQPLYNMLVVGDNDRQTKRIIPTDVQHTSGFRDDSKLFVGDSIASRIQNLEQELMSKDLQVSRLTRQLEENQRAGELNRQQLQDATSDTQRQLAEARSRVDSILAEKDSLQRQFNALRSRSEEQQQQAEESLQQWKLKNKKLEKELELLHKGKKVGEAKIVQLEREVDALKLQSGAASQQFEHIKRQFHELLNARVHLEDQVRAKDCEINQLKSAKLDYDRDLRDTRANIERLEAELRAAKERIYVVTEEKNRIEDQLSSSQSTAFTSEHQLQSLQTEIQNANVNSSHLSAQLAKATADNQELKLRLQEHQKITLTDREEISNLRQKLQQLSQQEIMQVELRNQQMWGPDPKSAKDMIRRLKAEHAECYAELQTLKMALEEEKLMNGRQRKQMETLQQEIDELHRQLETSQEETATTRQQYYKLKHELLNNTTKQWSIIENGLVDM